MKQSPQTFWVGVFVLVGFGALGALIILFGQTAFFSRQADAYTLNIKFDRATGIRDGTIVTVGGIQVGRVRDVGFVDPEQFDAGVNVEIVFDQPQYRFHQHTRAQTNAPGLGEGRPPITILPGPSDGAELASGASIPGVISSAVESLIPKEIVNNFDRARQRIEDAAAALTPVLDDLHVILQPRHAVEVDAVGGPPGNLFSAIERLDAGLKHFNEVLGDPGVRSQLRASIDNFHAMTEEGRVMVTEMKLAADDARATADGAKKLIETTSSAVERIDGQVDRVARLMVGDLEIAGQALTRLNTILEKAERGEGTLGRIIADNRLYESMVLTFRRLAETTEEFRKLVKEWQKGEIRVAL